MTLCNIGTANNNICHTGPETVRTDDEDDEPYESRAPPMDAIANGNWIGVLPLQFAGMTRTDELSVSLMVPCVFLATIVGTNQKKICSHYYVIKNADPIIRHVPADITGSYRLTLVGALTSEAIAKQRIRYPLNVPLDRSFLEWALCNHSDYIKHQSFVNLSAEDVTDEGCVIDRTDSSENPVCAELITSMTFGSTSYNTGDATSMDTSATSSTNDYTETDIRSKFIFQMSNVPGNDAGPTDFLARNSSNYSYGKNFSDVPLFFPTLIPYGCGGPAQARIVRMSAEHWIKRALRVGKDGLFQKHWGFLPVAFDYIAFKKACTQQYISMRMNKTAIQAGVWKKSDINECVKYSNILEQCLRRGEKVYHTLSKFHT